MASMCSGRCVITSTPLTRSIGSTRTIPASGVSPPVSMIDSISPTTDTASAYSSRNIANDMPASQSTSNMRTVASRSSSRYFGPDRISTLRVVSMLSELPSGTNGVRMPCSSLAATCCRGTTWMPYPLRFDDG